MKILLGLALLGLVLFALVYVFAIGHTSAFYQVHLELRDAMGQPLAYQPVVVWRYDYPRQELRTDAGGKLTWSGYEGFATNAVFGPSRPEAFPIRLTFPSLSPLYYRFEAANNGPVAYQVFNSEYDYTFGGQWVGDFDAIGHRLRSATEPDEAGKVNRVVSPTDGRIPQWRTRVIIRQLPANQNNANNYALDLDLEQNGVEFSITP